MSFQPEDETVCDVRLLLGASVNDSSRHVESLLRCLYDNLTERCRLEAVRCGGRGRASELKRLLALEAGDFRRLTFQQMYAEICGKASSTQQPQDQPGRLTAGAVHEAARDPGSSEPTGRSPRAGRGRSLQAECSAKGFQQRGLVIIVTTTPVAAGPEPETGPSRSSARLDDLTWSVLEPLMAAHPETRFVIALLPADDHARESEGQPPPAWLRLLCRPHPNCQLLSLSVWHWSIDLRTAMRTLSPGSGSRYIGSCVTGAPLYYVADQSVLQANDRRGAGNERDPQWVVLPRDGADQCCGAGDVRHHEMGRFRRRIRRDQWPRRRAWDMPAGPGDNAAAVPAVPVAEAQTAAATTGADSVTQT